MKYQNYLEEERAKKKESDKENARKAREAEVDTIKESIQRTEKAIDTLLKEADDLSLKAEVERSRDNILAQITKANALRKDASKKKEHLTLLKESLNDSQL